MNIHNSTNKKMAATWKISPVYYFNDINKLKVWNGLAKNFN